MVCSFLYCIYYFRSGFKFHIGNPHTYKIIICIIKLLVRSCMEYVLTETVCIECIGISSVNYFVKIVFQFTASKIYNFLFFNFVYYITYYIGSRKRCHKIISVGNILNLVSNLYRYFYSEFNAFFLT